MSLETIMETQFDLTLDVVCDKRSIECPNAATWRVLWSICEFGCEECSMVYCVDCLVSFRTDVEGNYMDHIASSCGCPDGVVYPLNITRL